MEALSTPEKIVFVKKKSKVKWILLGLVLLLLIAGGVFGWLVYRFFHCVRPEVVVEAGDPMPESSAFLDDPVGGIACETDLSQWTSTMLGEYKVTFSWLWFTQESKLRIRDSIPPEGETRDLTMTVKDHVNAEDFIVSYRDATEVNIRFVIDPDMQQEGKQTVNILLEDQGNNHTILKATLTLYDEEHPPVIQGAQNKTVFVGDTISYRAGIQVKTDTDETPELSIDSSKVDLDTPGIYPVTYTATDVFGRSSSVTVRVTVEEKPANYESMILLEKQVDEKLAELLKPGMSEIEKLFAIFRYVRLVSPWNRGRTEHDAVDQALKAMAGNPGDCFTHAALYQAMLERAGFLCTLVEKDNETGMHFWLMVCIDGNWYHSDPSPIYVRGFVTFLSTDAQLKDNVDKYRPHLYDLGYSALPATPLTSPAEVVFNDGDYYLTILQ